MNRLFKPLALGLLAAALQALLVLAIIPLASEHVTPLYNQDRFLDGYDQLADNLVHGNGYRFFPDTARTLMREPGYPLLLAGLALVFGSSFTAVKVVNIVLALATAWLMMKLAARISDSRVLQLLPPLLFLFHPATLIAESRGGVEILFTFLVVLFLLLLHSALTSNAWRYWMLSGLVLGLTVLVRSTLLLFPVFLVGYLLVFDRLRASGKMPFSSEQMPRIPFWHACGKVAVIVIAMVAVLSPWIVRNYRLTHRLIPTASVLGVSAHAGEYLCTHRSEAKPWFEIDRDAAQTRTQIATQLGLPFRDGYYYQAFYSTADELKFSSYLAQRVFGEYESNPLLCARCMALNLFNFWFTGKSAMATAMNVVLELPYLVLAAIGVVRAVKKGRLILVGPMVLLILYVMAVHVPILAQARYSMPLIPLLSILAVIGLMPARTMAENFPVRGADPEINAAIAVASPSQTPAPSLAGCGMEKE